MDSKRGVDAEYRAGLTDLQGPVESAEISATVKWNNRCLI